MSEQRDITINVPVLARVEGEGALSFTARKGRIEDLKLTIFEPPRLFEKFLEGRSYEEVPDMVARICGICPVAYQMSAVQAIESVFGVEVTPWVQAMRRVMYCGEWIQSHALHIHLLAAPDFLGYHSAIDMAAEHADIVQRGLRLQGLGNKLIALLGARSVHPVGVCVGGFHHAPSADDVAVLQAELQQALGDADDLIAWTAALALPEDRQAFISVALSHEQTFAIEQGRIISSAGLDIANHEYEQHFEEFQVPHSTAFHALLDGQPYLVGPLARLNLNVQQLPPEIQSRVAQTAIAFPSQNMFHSMVARAIEIRYALGEALLLLKDYEIPKASKQTVTPKAGIGYGATEAPRGILWHRYELDSDGKVVKANIVPPTSQNQARIEDDLRASLESYGLEHSDDELRLRGEMVIRNYDPCIS
ncbi:MAG: Ni/Fe hydrogenase subunit alpha, partial [Gammaproteobacteria bacterium]